jgi:hypothetical protein
MAPLLFKGVSSMCHRSLELVVSDHVSSFSHQPEETGQFVKKLLAYTRQMITSRITSLNF